MKSLKEKNKPDGISRRIFLGSTSSMIFCASSTFGIVRPTSALAETVRSYTLTVQEDGTKLTYNGISPGEVLEAYPGERLDVHLINALPPGPNEGDCPDDHNKEHGLNTTNLHTHGLHVSPKVDSSGTFDADNVFLNVTPIGQVNSTCVVPNLREGETHYRFEIPADHPSGTFWYHAHKHGSTNHQVSRGLAGPIIIRDRPGSMPPYIEAAKERIFMFTPEGAVAVGSDGSRVLNPRISLKKGAVERWRVINSDPRRDSFVRLTLPDDSIELWQIAFDGLTLEERIRVDPSENSDPWINHAALAPGNRTDFMVYVPKEIKPGELLIVAEKFLGSGMHPPDLPKAARPVDITVEILDEETNELWSEDDKLPGPGLLPFANAPTKTREVRFGNGVIDNQKYDGEVKNTMVLGDEESWTIFNDDFSTHPFHIHVNPFFVTHINGEELDPDSPLRRWQDTVALPPTLGSQGSVTFDTRFETFSGEFVLHCHILRHEDNGMMQKVRVIDDA